MSQTTRDLDRAGDGAEASIRGIEALAFCSEPGGEALVAAALARGLDAEAAVKEVALALGPSFADAQPLTLAAGAQEPKERTEGAPQPLLEGAYRGHPIYAPARPDGLWLLDALAILEEHPLEDAPAGLRLHLTIEASKQALAELRARGRLEGEGGIDDGARLEYARAAALAAETPLRAAASAPPPEAPGSDASVIARDGGGAIAAIAGAPLLVMRRAHPWLLLTLPRGATAEALPLLVDLIDLGLTPEAALRAPRCRWIGERSLALDAGFDPALREALQGRQHELEARAPGAAPSLQALCLDEETQRARCLMGGSTPPGP
ncbi:MAG: hypothetical protein OEY14_18205 [Myxococcales bacterium]|nr:hypothetical protein [Myxococcales bacterium]